MSTLKGTTKHPRCRHTDACWDLLEWFQLFSTSQNTSQIQFRTFLKKKSNCLVPMFLFSWRPFRWRINYLCRTDIDEARAFFFSRHTETQGTDRIQFRQFRTFWKYFTFLGFHGVVLVKTFPLMYQLLM